MIHKPDEGMLEVEIKARVRNLEEIRERLLLSHATPSVRTHERDVYFNAPDRDFGITDEALRLRYSDGEAILTYKGPKRKEYRFKAREELNTIVGSGSETEMILERLGFTRVAEVEKWREYYSYKGALVSLDDVSGLGYFIEIEAGTIAGLEHPEDLVQNIAEELGIKGEPILSSYLELLLSKR